MRPCVLLTLARRYHPSISSSHRQSSTCFPPPWLWWLLTIASIDARKSLYGFDDSMDIAVAPPNAFFVFLLSLSTEASGSKKRRGGGGGGAGPTASAEAEASEQVAELRLSREAEELEKQPEE
uniref:Uncharacterized protein n=1 Tax=Oryza brachyantha TaxID=4533 RepID=J3MPJ7_ORYBR